MIERVVSFKRSFVEFSRTCRSHQFLLKGGEAMAKRSKRKQKKKQNNESTGLWRIAVVAIFTLGLLMHFNPAQTAGANGSTGLGGTLAAFGNFLSSLGGDNSPDIPDVATPNIEQNPRLARFIGEYGGYAQVVSQESGIPYEAIIASASWESRYGESQLTQQCNNFNGLKAGSTWDGDTISLPTWEEVNGVRVETTADWRCYPSPLEGFRGYANVILNSGYYDDAVPAYQATGDPMDYFRRLFDDNNPKYGTDSTYLTHMADQLALIPPPA